MRTPIQSERRLVTKGSYRKRDRRAAFRCKTYFRLNPSSCISDPPPNVLFLIFALCRNKDGGLHGCEAVSGKLERLDLVWGEPDCDGRSQHGVNTYVRFFSFTLRQKNP